jgi:hypothetical protein
MKREKALAYAFCHQVDVCAWCNYISSIMVRYVGVHYFEVPTCQNHVSMVNKTYQMVQEITVFLQLLLENILWIISSYN